MCNLPNSTVTSTPERRVPWGYMHSNGPVHLGGVKPRGRDKMTPIVQIPYSHHSDFFLWNFVYFHSNLIENPQFQSTIIQHWFRYWLGIQQDEATIWTNDGVFHWHIYIYIERERDIQTCIQTHARTCAHTRTHTYTNTHTHECNYSTSFKDYVAELALKIESTWIAK